MKKDWLILSFVFTLISALFFLFVIRSTKGGMDNVYKSWDGPSYVLAAQSLYVPSVATRLNFIHSPEIRENFTFLPAHFPLYPLLIRFFSSLGYFHAALGLSLVFSLLTILAFYELLTALHFAHPLLITLPLIVFPPRWFVIAHTGSSEPLFLFLMLLSLLYFVKRRLFFSAGFAAFAQLARPQGALLGLGFLLVAVSEMLHAKRVGEVVKKYLPYLLVPLALLAVFIYYRRQTGNFWAFFDAIAIFHHFRPELFPAFKFPAENIETFWQEINVFDFTLYLTAIFTLFHRPRLRNFAWLALPFYLPLIFLQHTDISRYSLPLFPLAYLAFATFVGTTSFNLALWLTTPALFRYAATLVSLNRAT